MTQKNILYVTRPLCAPWDEASKNFAHDLARTIQGHDITIMTAGHVADVSPSVHQESCYSACHFGVRQKYESLLFQARARGAYAIAHYFFTPTPLTTGLITKFLVNHKKTKTIQTVATLRDDMLSEEQLRRVFWADHLVTYTRFAKDRLIAMGLPNVSHAYPGIDLSRFTPTEKDPAILAHFAIPKDAHVILYPGEYVRLGATDLIIDALCNLWRSNDPLAAKTILLLGLRVKNSADAAKKNAVLARLAAEGFQDRVRTSDTFADMNGLYNTADIVLFPVANMHGKFDVPLAVIEAYACAKPVIVSDLPRLAEFTDPTVSVIIRAGYAEDLTRAIRDLLHDPERRACLGASAATYARTTFNIQTTAHHYARLYSTL